MNRSQLEHHFDSVDLSKMQPGGELHFTQAEVTADPGAVITKICGIYHAVRPFLDWADNFFLIPAKIRKVITNFITLMDTVCPAPTPQP